MGYYYFDTDAFVKILVPEVGHDQCLQIYNNRSNTIILNQWTILETYSALNRLKNNNEINIGFFKRAASFFNQIITNEAEGKAPVRVVDVRTEDIQSAVELVNERGSLYPGDSVQVAIAIRYKKLDIQMVTGDAKVRKACEAYGIPVINANNCICQACGSPITFSRIIIMCDKCGTCKVSVQEAKCQQCGKVCSYCANMKWCERIKKTLVVS